MRQRRQGRASRVARAMRRWAALALAVSSGAAACAPDGPRAGDAARAPDAAMAGTRDTLHGSAPARRSGGAVAQLVCARPSARALAGDAFVVVTRAVDVRTALAWRPLGRVVLQGAPSCPPRLADRSGVRIVPIAGRPAFAIFVTWMSDSSVSAGLAAA